MLIEARIAKAFGYEYCTLFPNARSAIARYIEVTGNPGTIMIPSNVCPALATATKHSKVYPNFVAVDSHTGMAPATLRLPRDSQGCSSGDRPANDRLFWQAICR